MVGIFRLHTYMCHKRRTIAERTHQVLCLCRCELFTMCIPYVMYVYLSVLFSPIHLYIIYYGKMKQSIAFAIHCYHQKRIVLKIKVEMCVKFFFSRAAWYWWFTHSLTHFLCLFFAYISVATMARDTQKKRCNFTLTVSECRQNNNKSCSFFVLSLLLMLYSPFHCKYWLCQ